MWGATPEERERDIERERGKGGDKREEDGGKREEGGGKRKGAFAIYLEPWHYDV